MNKKKLIIIISITIVTLAVGTWLLLNAMKQPDKPSGGSNTDEKTLSQKYDDNLATINDDLKLSNGEKINKTIETMEAARKEFEAAGDIDKVNEIDANLEMIRSTLSQSESKP